MVFEEPFFDDFRSARYWGGAANEILATWDDVDVLRGKFF